MKRVALLFGIILLINSSVQKVAAQFYFYDNTYFDNPVLFEIGGSAGIMNCLTDLGGKSGVGKKFIKDVNFGNTQFAGSVFLSATYHNAVAIRLEGTFGQVKAHDSILKSDKGKGFGRYERNLSFRSTISEISLTAEFHPIFIFKNWTDGDEQPPRYSPYLLAGVGFFSFNPQAKLLNNWVDLQPLSTEGQGFKEYPDKTPYKLQQMNIPLGAGIKYELSSLFNLRVEAVYRKLSTDYLDDVSGRLYADPTLFPNYLTGTKLTNALLLNDRRYEIDPTFIPVGRDIRGNPKNNDGYFTFNVKFSILFGRERIKK